MCVINKYRQSLPNLLFSCKSKAAFLIARFLTRCSVLYWVVAQVQWLCSSITQKYLGKKVRCPCGTARRYAYVRQYYQQALIRLRTSVLSVIIHMLTSALLVSVDTLTYVSTNSKCFSHFLRSGGRSDTLVCTNPRSTNHCMVDVDSTNKCFTDDAIATRSR